MIKYASIMSHMHSHEMIVNNYWQWYKVEKVVIKVQYIILIPLLMHIYNGMSTQIITCCMLQTVCAFVQKI